MFVLVVIFETPPAVGWLRYRQPTGRRVSLVFDVNVNFVKSVPSTALEFFVMYYRTPSLYFPAGWTANVRPPAGKSYVATVS